MNLSPKPFKKTLTHSHSASSLRPINGLASLANQTRAQGHESLHKLVKQRQYESNAIDGILGVFLIIAGMLIFIVSAYSLIISKFLMPHTGNMILDWIKDDEYYCCLVPATLASTPLFMYANWVAMKYFRHS